MERVFLVTQSAARVQNRKDAHPSMSSQRPTPPPALHASPVSLWPVEADESDELSPLCGAWWACWAVLLANLTYTIIFGAHDSAILIESLALDILVPVLLLVQIPRFFGRHQDISADS
jgi:hypothetical protein